MADAHDVWRDEEGYLRVVMHTDASPEDESSAAKSVIELFDGRKEVIIAEFRVPQTWQMGNGRAWASVTAPIRGQISATIGIAVVNGVMRMALSALSLAQGQRVAFFDDVATAKAWCAQKRIEPAPPPLDRAA